MRALGSGAPVQYNSGFAYFGRFIMRTLWVLIVALCMAGCTSMLLGNTSSREGPPPRSTADTTSPVDSAISGEIRRKLNADDELGRYSIGIRSVNGQVTLSGTLGSYELRDKAVALARETDGVKNIDNRIIVNTNL